MLCDILQKLHVRSDNLARESISPEASGSEGTYLGKDPHPRAMAEVRKCGMTPHCWKYIGPFIGIEFKPSSRSGKDGKLFQTWILAHTPRHNMYVGEQK